MTEGDRVESFRAFVEDVEPRLRRALVATFGSDRGREAAAEALAFAWEQWDKVSMMGNPAGYLYRVGRSRTRVRRPRAVFDGPHQDEPWVEPRLARAVAALPRRQRQAVLLVYAEEWTHAEAAELLGINPSTIQRHLDRGLAALRRRLEVGHDR